MVWGQIASAVVGGYMSNQAAKKQAKAMDAANQMSNMGYLDAQPYIQYGYSGGKKALQNMLNQGAYTGPTYAGLNAMQIGALGNQFGFGGDAFNYGQNLAAAGAGFGSNYGDLYNRAMNNDNMQTAIDYATANRGGLVDAALRDSTRQLTQETLPGINRLASRGGNTNSSRAGVADAIAYRDYQDRAADISAGITDRLVGRSLSQQQQDFANAMNANQGLAGAFNTGMSTGFKGLGQQLAAGGAFQQDLQNQYQDEQNRFERERDFQMDAYARYMAQILGRAPMEGKNYTPNLVDPTSAALSGAIGGFGLGGQLFGGGNFGFGSGSGGGMPAGYNPYSTYLPSDYANPMVL